ncbi:hypothetical protein OKW35_005237 [Paraburkholderia sp. MM5477-R1]
MWYAYTSDRRGEHPPQHLADFAGVLQADAFAGYAELYRGERIQELHLWRMQRAERSASCMRCAPMP